MRTLGSPLGLYLIDGPQAQGTEWVSLESFAVVS